jgi:xylan 1,4-beta-xylosidase
MAYSITNFRTISVLVIGWLILSANILFAQTSNQPGTNGIKTYVNPVLPGDHPDQTLLRMGKDFYSTGSNFHFTPYLPILHSTDLMHWEVIARVIPPTSAIPNNDTPSGGTWQGALAYFNNKYWVYFSNNAGGGQYFCNAANPKGPWSAPVKVNTNSGVYGYDNSIFVDDDGTPWMLLKNGQENNGLQKLGMDGQPVGQALNLNWINAPDANGNRPYSWAEGPVMCKRNGRYYYFVAGNVVGGQYVLSTSQLTADQSKWTRHGNFWQQNTNAGGFTGPNHITQPVKLDDGTWWCLSHAYDNGGWEGQGRQSHLHQVIWDANGVPKGIPVTLSPVAGPDLPSDGLTYEFIRSDYFSSSVLSLNWHFLNKANANTSRYSLSERPGFLRLKPGTGTTHILQKDKGKYYSLTTKVDLNATAAGQQAGIKMTSGNDDIYFTLYTGNTGGTKKIGMAFQGTSTEINNTIGNTVWLRVERALHILTAFCSADGKEWTQIGTKDVSNLDKSQTDYNKWVGTSVGLYATAASADFDQFSYRYGFAPIKVEGRNNWYGVTYATKTPGRTVTNSATGDWLMMAGTDLGAGNTVTSGIEVNVASAGGNASLEVWLDNIGGTGTKVATIPVSSTGGADTWKNITGSFSASGQHDVYLRWVGGANAFFVNTIKFLNVTGTPPTVSITAPADKSSFTTLQTITLTADASDSDGSVSGVEFYDGNTLLGSDNAAPYSFTWTGANAGTHSISARATDNSGLTATSSVVVITVQAVQSPFRGTPHQIPGRIEAEEFDLGGEGVAYHEANTNGNEGGATLRKDEVDVETTGDTDGEYNVGYILQDEWLEYTVDVLAAAPYNIDLRLAADGDSKTLHIEMDGQDISGPVSVPNTGGWQKWTTVTLNNINLTKGQHVMRISFDANYFNINYMKFYTLITGTEKQETSAAEIFPNPFSADGLQVKTNEKTTYRILDMTGSIAEEGYLDKEGTIGTTLPAGFYMLTIQNQSGVKSYKINRQ